ncbi:hypothetical protein Y032_0030g2154 [Ancylostoma ceylanicum]|uniref:Uncharacterized protein n=1 Tax=Ancylostoma ceylanicum TaxID=53326 RepID=A0A016URP8_9BILA|nr:hypothetical protein Y032_0030g2154 [Ancylostoma ceylanicum]
MLDTVANDKNERLRQCFQDFVAGSAPPCDSSPTSETVFTTFQAANVRSRIITMRCYAAHGGTVWPTDARSRRCCVAHRCPIAMVLCGPKMPVPPVWI